MPAPGRHGPRPPHVPLAHARRGADRLRRRGARAARARRGDRARRRHGGRRADRVLVSIFAPGGWDSLSLLYPIGDPRYRKLRPSLALKPDDGPGLRLRLASPLAPLARAARKLHAHGKADGVPGDRLLAPRPVALHLAALLGGRRARPAGGHRLARAAARRDRRRGQRDAGPVARLVAAPVARDGARARRDADRPGRLRLRLATTSGTSPASCSRRRSARSARLVEGPRPEPDAGEPHDAARPTTCAASSAASSARTARRTINPKAKYPDGDFGAPALRRSRRCSTPASRSGRRRSQAPGSYDTHADQQGPLQDGRQGDRGGPRRVPGRPRAPRHRRPRAHARLERVRPPRRSRTTRTAPTTAPRASRS